MVFTGLVLIEFFKAYNYRSDRKSAFSRPFANQWLNWAIVWESALLLLVLNLPILQHAIGTFGLPAEDWLIVTGAALTIFPVLELAKWMERRGWFGAMT
jgi:Ca2+-transporting ATPase